MRRCAPSYGNNALVPFERFRKIGNVINGNACIYDFFVFFSHCVIFRKLTKWHCSGKRCTDALGMHDALEMLDVTPVDRGRRHFGATSLLSCSCAFVNIEAENRPASLRVHSGP